MSDLIASAVSEGLWAEKKDKDGKVYYVNKGDKRTTEKSMRPKALEKFLKEQPPDKGKDSKKKDGKKEEKKEKESAGGKGKEKPVDGKGAAKEKDAKQAKGAPKEDLVAQAVAAGLWAEKKDKDGKVYYVNKGDKRTTEKSMRPKALEKFLAEKGLPESDSKTDGKKDEKKTGKKEKKEAKEEDKGEEPSAGVEEEEPELLPLEEVPEEFRPADDLPDDELAMRKRLRKAYALGAVAMEEKVKKAAYVHPGSRPPPRAEVGVPVEAKEDWAPVEWPRWQSLLAHPAPHPATAGNVWPKPVVELRGAGLTPAQRLAALRSAPTVRPATTYRTDDDLREHLLDYSPQRLSQDRGMYSPAKPNLYETQSALSHSRSRPHGYQPPSPYEVRNISPTRRLRSI